MQLGRENLGGCSNATRLRQGPRPKSSVHRMAGFWTSRPRNHSSQESEIMLTTPSQITAARGLLNWTQERLAKESKVSLSTVRRIEQSEKLNCSLDTLAALSDAFAWAGIELLNHGNPGVQYWQSKDSTLGPKSKNKKPTKPRRK